MPVFREPGVAAAFSPFDFYLGPHATDPIVENDGDSLVEGSYYWNTADNVVKFYNGTTWQSSVLGSPSNFPPVAQVATVSNSTTVETDLNAYTLQANTLVRDRQGFRITAWGNCVNDANTKIIRLKFGSATIGIMSFSAGQHGQWRMVAEIYRTGAGAQASTVQIINGGTGPTIYATSNSLTQTDTADIIIKTTGEGSAGSVINGYGMLVEPIN